jgi:hypothetical protein
LIIVRERLGLSWVGQFLERDLSRGDIIPILARLGVYFTMTRGRSVLSHGGWGWLGWVSQQMQMAAPRSRDTTHNGGHDMLDSIHINSCIYFTNMNHRGRQLLDVHQFELPQGMWTEYS